MSVLVLLGHEERIKQLEEKVQELESLVESLIDQVFRGGGWE